MELRQMIEELDKNIEKCAPAMDAMSDNFAAHPEISGEEYETSKEIVRVLREAGFEVEYPACNIPTAFVARCGKGGGAKVAILTEYDALPEIGHACGHNLHGSMSVLTGLSLYPILKDAPCELLVVGTPAEETDGAKVKIAAQGLFNGCDFAMMIHSCGGKNLIECRALAIDCIEFTFTGKASHAAAAPWDGVNALNGLQLFFHAIDMLRQHVKPEVRMHGIYYDGGAAPNVVPERAIGRFYFRAPKRAYLDEVVEKVYNCARGAALATGTEVTWRNFEGSFKDVLPNGPAEAMARKYFEEMGLPVTPNEGFIGSSDMGDVSYSCPAIQPEIDISGEPIEGHTRAFAAATLKPRAKKAMRDGAKIIGRCMLEVIADKATREKIRASYDEELALAKE